MRHLSLLLLIANLLPSVACQKKTPAGILVDPKLISYLPRETAILAGINMDGLTGTQIYNRHKGQLNLPQLNTAAERFGLDPRRDLAEVLAAWAVDEPLMLARGRFSASQVTPKLLAAGSRTAEYRKQTLFTNKSEDRADAVFFPKQNILIAGSLAAVHAVIDNRAGEVPEALRTRLETLPTSDQIWMVSSEGLPLDRVPMRADVRSALSNIVGYISGASMGIGLDDGAHVQVDLSCVSLEGAKQVHDALRGGIGLARLTTRDDALDLLRLYDSIRIDQNDLVVHIRADLPADLADKLSSYLNGR